MRTRLISTTSYLHPYPESPQPILELSLPPAHSVQCTTHAPSHPPYQQPSLASNPPLPHLICLLASINHPSSDPQSNDPSSQSKTPTSPSSCPDSSPAPPHPRLSSCHT